MGFLDNIRNSKKNNLHPNWKTLDSEAQLKEIINGSHERPAMIFKHSTTCGISAGAKHRLESNWEIDPEKMDFYYLDLLNHRPVSNLIAELLNVIHQSPQIILIKDGAAVYNTSHHEIAPQAVNDALAAV